MAEAQAIPNYGPPKRVGRLIAIAAAVLIAFAIVVIAVDRLLIETPQERAERVCIDKYNSLVRQAKSNLIKGDRIGAINSLTATKAQLHQCETTLATSVSGVMQ